MERFGNSTGNQRQRNNSYKPASITVRRDKMERPCTACGWNFRPKLKAEVVCPDCLSDDKMDGRMNNDCDDRRLDTDKKF
jgi:Zn finger protein HypA/HybF involved in hydrogenase expression